MWILLWRSQQVSATQSLYVIFNLCFKNSLFRQFSRIRITFDSFCITFLCSFIFYISFLWVESTMRYVDVGCFCWFCFLSEFPLRSEIFWTVWREKENRKTHLDCNLRRYFTIHTHMKAFQMLSCTLPRIQMFNIVIWIVRFKGKYENQNSFGNSIPSTIQF